MNTRKEEIPSLEEIENERERMQYNRRYRSVLLSTIFGLVIIAAAAIMAANLWLPFLRIQGASMSPTLSHGDIVVCTKSDSFQRGDCMAFYYYNKILVRRVIGLPGEKINILDDGTITVDGIALEETYITEAIETTYAEGDVEFPYEVPEDTYFVLGDNRESVIDSRYQALGCVSKEQIFCKLQLRLWPLQRLEVMN